MTLEQEIGIIIEYLKEHGIIRDKYLTRADDAADKLAAI